MASPGCVPEEITGPRFPVPTCLACQEGLNFHTCCGCATRHERKKVLPSQGRIATPHETHQHRPIGGFCVCLSSHTCPGMQEKVIALLGPQDAHVWFLIRVHLLTVADLLLLPFRQPLLRMASRKLQSHPVFPQTSPAGGTHCQHT